MKKTLSETKLPAKNLTLEITESRIAVDNDPTVIDNMLTLKALGISIAIDDLVPDIVAGPTYKNRHSPALRSTPASSASR